MRKKQVKKIKEHNLIFLNDIFSKLGVKFEHMDPDQQPQIRNQHLKILSFPVAA